MYFFTLMYELVGDAPRVGGICGATALSQFPEVVSRSPLPLVPDSRHPGVSVQFPFPVPLTIDRSNCSSAVSLHPRGWGIRIFIPHATEWQTPSQLLTLQAAAVTIFRSEMALPAVPKEPKPLQLAFKGPRRMDVSQSSAPDYNGVPANGRVERSLLHGAVGTWPRLLEFADKGSAQPVPTSLETADVPTGRRFPSHMVPFLSPALMNG